MTPLKGLRILDFSTLLPGPFATMILGDLGADIIRLEALIDPIFYANIIQLGIALSIVTSDRSL